MRKAFEERRKTGDEAREGASRRKFRRLYSPTNNSGVMWLGRARKFEVYVRANINGLHLLIPLGGLTTTERIVTNNIRPMDTQVKGSHNCSPQR
jgi:hypothetical protein